jgi:hypothetical protein
MLLRHTVMKAGNVTAPHSTNFLAPTLMHYFYATGGGGGARHDGTQHAAGEPHKFCTQFSRTTINLLQQQ